MDRFERLQEIADELQAIRDEILRVDNDMERLEAHLGATLAEQCFPPEDSDVQAHRPKQGETFNAWIDRVVYAWRIPDHMTPEEVKRYAAPFMSERYARMRKGAE